MEKIPVPKFPNPVTLLVVIGLTPNPLKPAVPVPNVDCCVLDVPNPENNDGADVVAFEPKPPKPPKVEPPILLVGAVDPKPNADVDAAAVVPNPPVLVPNPKF